MEEFRFIGMINSLREKNIPDDCDDSSNTESSTQDASRVLVLTHNEKVRKFSDFIMHERKRYMVHELRFVFTMKIYM
jgi:hypothetical protein